MFQGQILGDLKAGLVFNTVPIELSPLWEAGQVVVFKAFKGSLALQKNGCCGHMVLEAF